MSATKIPLLTLSLVATAAIAKYQAVGYDGAVAGAGEEIFGLATSDGASGEVIAADVLGTGLAIAGATVTAGQALEVGTNGRLIPLDSGTQVARVMPGSGGGDGDLIEVFLIPA
jgi:hypothetical protein